MKYKLVNKNELLFVVDEHDMPLKPMPRHLAIKKGHWRRTVHVWIINDKKQIVCQQRSLKKDTGAGLWEPTVAGHIGPDDNYFTGAVREVREETGLPISTEDLNLVKIYKDHDRREYRGIFYCKISDLAHHHITREEDEVEQVKLLHVKTVRKYMKANPDNWTKPGYEREMFSVLN